MNTIAESPPTFSVARPPLTLVLRQEKNGARLAREPLTAADLSDAISEAWRECCLRKGHPGVPLAGLPVRLAPILRDGDGSLCTGFALEVTTPDGRTARCDFTNRSLKLAATRLAQRLKDTGQFQDNHAFTYEIAFDPRVVAASAHKPHAAPGAVTMKSRPLNYLTVPLRPLLRQSTALNVTDDACFSVFYTEEALAKAERFARKGSQSNPPVETGSVLIGPLCSCPESGEFFQVVTDGLEVMDAEQTVFSLDFTGKSWTRIQAVMRAKQATHPERCDRLQGQAHGHNFVPNDGKICEACLKRPACNLTNIFVSLDDQDFSRAVFAHQPWQLCHIFGLAARGDRLNGLFTLQDGRLQDRGFFTLPEFKPEEWAANTAINLK